MTIDKPILGRRGFDSDTPQGPWASGRYVWYTAPWPALRHGFCVTHRLSAFPVDDCADPDGEAGSSVVGRSLESVSVASRSPGVWAAAVAALGVGRVDGGLSAESAGCSDAGARVHAPGCAVHEIDDGIWGGRSRVWSPIRFGVSLTTPAETSFSACARRRRRADLRSSRA